MNLYSDKFLFNAIIVLLWEIWPNVKIILKFFILFISELKKTLHFFTSNEFGLLLGGKHLTAFVILQFILLVSLNSEPLSEILYFFKKLNSKFPGKSPLKILPVLFAPFNPGAKPTIKISLESDP